MIRLFIIDDHPVLRNSLRRLFAQEPGLVVVGEAAHGQDLLDQLPAIATDVVCGHKDLYVGCIFTEPQKNPYLP